MIRWVRLSVLIVGLLLIWQMVVMVSGVPAYILPGPFKVIRALFVHLDRLWRHTLVTGIEIVAGLIIGAIFGAVSALFMMTFKPVKRWLFPVLVISQAIPVFALAPLLVLWFGYGMGSKIVMAVLIIFFPVTAAFYDGLRRTDPEWLELARVMDASPGAILVHIRIPSALPALASGLRVATAVAPIGAVVGEWVGASQGLGFYMLHANARMQTDLLFAALTVLATLALVLYFAVDRLMTHLVYWQRETVEEER